MLHGLKLPGRQGRHGAAKQTNPVRSIGAFAGITVGIGMVLIGEWGIDLTRSVAVVATESVNSAPLRDRS
jgi:hypothetical protein